VTRALAPALVLALALALVACTPPAAETGPQPVALVVDAGVITPPRPDAAAPGIPAWLKGNTHVHAEPSGDSKTPIAEVLAWYQEAGYDFIALTDHNHVSEVGGMTAGQVAVQREGLIVLAGVELTYNPDVCDPAPPALDGKCRIHANLIGPTARPEGRIEWANRESLARIDTYQRALDRAAEWGGLVQLNHPTWHWGMTPELLIELGRRGVRMIEIANKQFMSWSEGDDTHASVETLWDAALSAGVTMWGVSSDDAHDYLDLELGTARYPAGGHFVMVWSSRDPESIVGALAAGRFYSSTGVLLSRAEVDGEALVVEISDDSPGEHVITFIGDGKVLSWAHGRAASQSLAGASYVRAVVRREDGARAWVQPARLHTAVGN